MVPRDFFAILRLQNNHVATRFDRQANHIPKPAAASRLNSLLKKKARMDIWTISINLSRLNKKKGVANGSSKRIG
jgi:hypothetical protein